MRSCLLILLLLVWHVSSADTVTVKDADKGRLCLASVVTPNDSPQSLSNPSGEHSAVSYSVSVSGRAAIKLSQKSGFWVNKLSSTDRHAIIVFVDGKRSASFFLEFGDPELSQCLFLAPLYQTWQLWPSSRTGSWCDCG